MTEIKIYTTPACPFCIKAKAFLKEHHIEYTDINIQEDEKARDEMMEKSGLMTVPVIDIDGRIIVGFDEEAKQKVKKALHLEE